MAEGPWLFLVFGFVFSVNQIFKKYICLFALDSSKVEQIFIGFGGPYEIYEEMMLRAYQLFFLIWDQLEIFPNIT